MRRRHITVLRCGDVMTGRGIDQGLPHPALDARDYVRLAELASGPISSPVDPAYIWGDALREMKRARADVRIVNLETSITRSDQRVTFDDLAKLIEADYTANGRKSIVDMLGRVAHLRAAFGNHRAIDITHKMLLAYVERRTRDGARPATIRYELVVFGRMYSLAIRAGMLTTRSPLPTI